MPFDTSQLYLLEAQPWRWTTQPVYGNGPQQPPTVAGVKDILDGVFVLIDDVIFEYMNEVLTTAQKTALAAWLYRVSSESPLPAGHHSAVEWHVPLWAGQTRATLLRIPASVWASPTVAPRAIVKTRFRKFFTEAP